jgi:hypothetical protein
MIRGGRDVVFGQSLVRRSSIGRNWIPRGTDVVPCAGLVFHPLHSWKRSPALINTSDKSIGTLTSNACCRGAAALVCTVTATVLSLLVMRVTVFLSTAWAAKLIARCFSWWRPEHQPLPVGCLKAVNFLGLLNASAEFSRHREVRFGSKADIAAVSSHVRFTPESGHCRTMLGCPLCAKSGHANSIQSPLVSRQVCSGTSSAVPLIWTTTVANADFPQGTWQGPE